MLQTFISCVFRAHDKFFISQNYTTLVYLVDLVIIVFVVVSGNKAFFIPLLFIFNRTLIIIFQLTHAIKMSWLGEINVFSKNLRSAVTLIPTSFNHSLITLGFAIVLQGNTFLVGRYLGSQAVVEFNTIRTLVNSMKSFFSVVYASFFPKFTVLYAKGNLEELGSRFKDLMVIVVVGSLIACGIFLFWGNDIFLIWTKGKVLLRFPFYYIMLVGALIQIIWNGASSLPFSLNENKLLKYYPLIAILGIILCIPFMSKWGLNIVAVSLVFVDFIMLILVLYVSRKIINGKI
ncbi:lipopolysaccharide biosynthesis protein [Flectobacillus sp. BAB-3569]|uniref:lipopolysaccharide biosynthesis protein n=1 Tax=Flectobacillus sp. BAB-3569 TaxID=1509483 RepID=UPI000BA2ED4F|nr:hypothetical protein [Flectobacillus sp. BAB-3569]PAC30619.1 hypothetical protein BWI92_11325 [Flectobacillus sp. BAB-3569]